MGTCTLHWRPPWLASNIRGLAEGRSRLGTGHHVDSAVKQQPLLSLIGVAAIGYAISFLIHSPSSPLASPKTHYFRR
jgi:hypothetical protein